jgi:hypothetical protein
VARRLASLIAAAIVRGVGIANSPTQRPVCELDLAKRGSRRAASFRDRALCHRVQITILPNAGLSRRLGNIVKG